MEDGEYLQRLGERIVLLRLTKGMSQLELANRLETKNTQVRRIERGQVNSTINMLRKIAAILEISVSELVNMQ